MPAATVTRDEVAKITIELMAAEHATIRNPVMTVIRIPVRMSCSRKSSGPAPPAPSARATPVPPKTATKLTIATPLTWRQDGPGGEQLRG